MPASITLNTPEGVAVPEGLIERGVLLALSGEGHDEGEISITFLMDTPILEMNRRWLGHDWVPDVLSFPLQQSPSGDAPNHSSPPMGDIYVGVEQAARQAEEHGVSLEEELLRLSIHGTLHILGYDHTNAEAERGEGLHFTRQEALVREALAGRRPV